MSLEAIVLAPGASRELSLRGTQLGILLTGDHSKDTTVFELTAKEGFTTGAHVHQIQKEFFYVLEGECELHAGDQVVKAKPGSFVFVPPGVPHNIINTSGKPAKMLMGVSPPGHEHYFEELADLLARDGPPDAKAIGELRRKFDTEQLSSLKAE